MMAVVPKLGGDEKFFSGDTAFLDSATDGGLGSVAEVMLLAELSGAAFWGRVWRTCGQYRYGGSRL